MFEISVTREFEEWYQALDADTAEKVSAELNVLERMGPGLDSLRASRLLLWFDGTAGSAVPVLALRQVGDALGQYVQRQHEALRCLETPSFLARFLKLEPRRAKHAHELIERLRSSVRATTLELALAHSQPRALSSWAWTGPSAAAQTALLNLLSFVGLRVEDVADTSSGLRELTIADLTPPGRLLYAIDAPRRRILAILGEALDRAYYGDSVRLAERRWRDYCRTLEVAPTL
jgi:hypothetical protein